jgi:hypothetical protein
MVFGYLELTNKICKYLVLLGGEHYLSSSLISFFFRLLARG